MWWFVARSSGIIAWALLTLSVCWGLLLSTRLLSRRVSPAWLLDLHRHLGGLAVVFTGIHLVGLVADSYVTFGWTELFIPMASSWKPGAVAFGIVAFYLLLAIEFTSLAMRRLPRSLWRWVHRSSFVLFGFATYHGLAAGTDAGNAWYRIATWTSIGVVVTLTLVLVAMARRARTRLSSLPPSWSGPWPRTFRTTLSNPPVVETLPAPVPAATIPLAPAAHVPAWSSVPGRCRRRRSPRFAATRIGRAVPARGAARSGGAAAPAASPRCSADPAASTRRRGAVVAASVAWLPPAGSAATPADDRELVTAGRVAADGGAPPTTAT